MSDIYSRCPQCGKRFICEIALGKKACWCMKVSPRKTKKTSSCLCRDCLQRQKPTENHVA
ncbi:MAG: cysteine-rich CWC family protein [Candidatus Marinimicrobia bacterium]|nr:cysteine-rich CWC family protein [Candidatus Neomarinimicrobiota bacterium]